jgi:uncharacterized repeat protein (TIGR01451 family)
MMTVEMWRAFGALSTRARRGLRRPQGVALVLPLVIGSSFGALALGGLSHVRATAPCGATGVPGGTGPTFTCTYTFTGAADTFTVPAGVTFIAVDAFGAQGSGGNFGASGGLGGESSSTLAVTSGEVLQVNVGGSGGFIGGGAGGPGVAVSGGAGGGASDVRTGAFGPTDRVVVAGGGGGGGAFFGGNAGGPGGGGNGGNGGNGAGGSVGGSGGGGGVGGAGGAGAGGGASGGSGTASTGGAGGAGFGSGAGGGGGYGGGGGGGGASFGVSNVQGAGGGGGGGLGDNLTTGVHSGNGQVTITYTVAAADLAITKSGPSVATQGVPFTYTLMATNNGPGDATGVTVTDALPTGVTFASATPGSCTQAAGTVTCALGSLANGASVAITITVTPTATSGTLLNSAHIAGNETDPDLSNNTSRPVSTTVLAGSVACAITRDGGPPLPGGGIGLVSIATHVEPRTTDHPGSSFRDEVCVDDASGADDAAGKAGPTGTLTFFLCDPTQVVAFGCPVGAGTQVGKPQRVEDNDLMIKSRAVKPKALGTYCWLVHYSGDANFAPADSTNATTECFTVTASKHK